MSAQDDLNAAALAYAVSQGYTKPAPPPPPPPPPPTVAAFDGSAVAQVSMPVVSGITPNITQTPPNPTGVWQGTIPRNGGYAYMNNDIRVTADPTGRFAKVFLAAPPAGNHNPYIANPQPPVTSAQQSIGRTPDFGKTWWYSEAVYVLSQGWQKPAGASFVSLNYQTVQYDQLALQLDGNNTWILFMNTGLLSGGKAANRVSQPLLPIQFDAWTDFVVGVTEAASNTGAVEVHVRKQGGSWQQLYRITGVPTFIWTNATGTPNVGSPVLDKQGMYTYLSQPPTTGQWRYRGLQRWASLQDAIASLG